MFSGIGSIKKICRASLCTSSLLALDALQMLCEATLWPACIVGTWPQVRRSMAQNPSFEGG